MDEIKVKGFRTIRLENDDGKVNASGCFSLPSPLFSGSKEEADAFIQGVKWAVSWWTK